METYGRYRLMYDTCESDPNPSVMMTKPGNASLEELVSMFDCFLKANGFNYKGKLEISEEKSQNDFWDGFFGTNTMLGSQATDLPSFSYFAEDKINLGLE